MYKRQERARESEAAWISTIHGFCARVLRTHALAAGIDPEYRVLDAVEAERLALDAFDGALAEFLERGESAQRLRMIAAYNPRKLADMVRTAYDHLRSQGKEPTLPVIDPPEPTGEREALKAAAAALSASRSPAGSGGSITGSVGSLPWLRRWSYAVRTMSASLRGL